MTKAHAKLRDGQVTQIEVEELVPGDVLLLEAEIPYLPMPGWCR